MDVATSLGERRTDLKELFENHKVSEHLKRHYEPQLDIFGGSTIGVIGQQLESLERLRANIEERRRGVEDKLKWKEEHVEMHLEMSLAGSLGFWLTVALLAGWAMLSRQPLTTMEHGEPRRCFWAINGWKSFHDDVHGRELSNDADLFRRLAFEVLSTNVASQMVSKLWEQCSELDVAEVVELTFDALAERLGFRSTKEMQPALRARLFTVIAVARKVLELSSNPATTNEVRARLRAADTPASRIAELRKLFKLPANFAAGSFLQSISELPAAHYDDCYLSGIGD